VGPLEVLGASLGPPVGWPLAEGAVEMLGATAVLGAVDAEGRGEGAAVGSLAALGASPGTCVGPVLTEGPHRHECTVELLCV
jgi:hypothetical protein